MASKFVVAVALFAVCHSSPVIRNARSYEVAYANGFGKTVASASNTPNGEQAFASNDNGDNIARGVYGTALPGQAYAKVSNEGDSSIGRTQPVYYPVPAPATVVTYQQYANVPEIPSLSPAPALAQSSALATGGSAISDARVQGNGYGSAISQAQTNEDAAIIAARNQGYQTVYTPVQQGYGAASSKAVAGQYGTAASSANVGAIPTRKSISWRFGTAYDHPASYVRAEPSPYGYNSANANSIVHSGQGIAKSVAQTTDTESIANSAANAQGGYANANADVKNGGYAYLRNTENNGFVNSQVNSGYNGVADAKARVDPYGVSSTANTNGQGSAKSTATNNGPSYAYRASLDGAGGWTNTDAQSNGSGFAKSSATSQGLSTAYRVLNSNASTHGSGSAKANAY